MERIADMAPQKMKRFDYWELPDEEKFALAEQIRKANLAAVDQGQLPVKEPDTFYARYGKRILDIILSLTAVILTAPIDIVLLIGALIDVGTPIFFHQRRVGKDKKVFVMTKIRNMTNERDENGVLLPPEQRVTKWGRFVRKTSLDELLNFWNILLGDMSVIGPRPLPDEYLGRYSIRHDARHLVRPGLDCPMHDSEKTNLTWQSRLDNDVWYVENISLKTDIKLMFQLIHDVLFGDRKDSRGEAACGCFMGYDTHGVAIDSNDITKEYYQEIMEGTVA